MTFKINDHMTYVGKIDWELRTFHGEEYSTHKGSSYNSYLVEDQNLITTEPCLCSCRKSPISLYIVPQAERKLSKGI